MRARAPGPLAALALVLVALSGCGAPTQTPAPGPARPAPVGALAGVRAAPDGWTFLNDQPGGDVRFPYLGNGYLGFQTGVTGCGWDGAKALPAFAAGLYVNDALVAIPSPAAVHVRSEKGAGFGARADELSGYGQELALRSGRLTTRAAWRAGTAAAELVTTCAPLRQRPHLALTRVHARNTGSEPLRIELPGEDLAAIPAWAGMQRKSQASGERGEPALFQAAAPGAAWVELGMASLLLGPDGPAAADPLGPASARLEPGREGDFVRLTAVYTSLDGPAPDQAARRAVQDAARAGTGTLDREQEAAWGALWASDIEIEGDPEAQAVARACRFFLLESLRDDVERGVPPMGLSSAAFNGHVFWDMDTWILPAVLPQNPELARAMLAYRLRTLPGARENAAATGHTGAAFAWESGASGRETAPEPFRNGRHVDGDVALAVGQYWLATQDAGWLRASGWPLLRATADYWATRVDPKPPAPPPYHLRGVTTPDENAGIVDDSAWTNYVARRNLETAAALAPLAGQSPDRRSTAVAQGLELPQDPQTRMILEYAGYRGLKTKQADALLLVHPGGMALSAAEIARMHDYYAPRVIPNGPAMTDAIAAVVAARLGRGQESLDRFRASYRPFMRPPFGMFSEKRTKDNLCFLTGASGVLQAILYGFAGLQLADSPTPQATPHLPPGWTSVSVRGIRWRGKAYDLRVDSSGAHWTPITP